MSSQNGSGNYETLVACEVPSGFGEHVIDTPKGAKILGFCLINDKPVIFLQANPRLERIRRKVFIFPPGDNPIPEGAKWIGYSHITQEARVPAGILTPGSAERVVRNIVFIHIFDLGEIEEAKNNLEVSV